MTVPRHPLQRRAWVVVERHTGRFLERLYPSGFVLWTLNPEQAREFTVQSTAMAIAMYDLPIAADVIEVT